MFCPKCGKAIADNANFCTGCGWSKNAANSMNVNAANANAMNANVANVSNPNVTNAMYASGNKKRFPLIPIVAVVAVIVVGFFASKIFMGGGSIAKDAKLVTSYSTDTTIDQMETVKFGSYYQSNGFTKEPIEWIVLDRQEGRTLLLSKYILDCKCYNNEFKDVTWETCDLRKWLNNDFYYQAFNGSEQGKIQTTNVINNNKLVYGMNGGNNTNDKVFCLSIDEVKNYFYQSDMESDNKRLATRGTNYAKNVVNDGCKLMVSDSSGEWYFGNSSFWLRSPGYIMGAACVRRGGYLSTDGLVVDYGSSGVRPALWISD